MTWMSPAFPVGAFAYSHGLEAAVEAGDLADAESAHDWIGYLVEHGSGCNDALFLAAAYRAAGAGAGAEPGTPLAELAELAAATAPSAERSLETLAQGTAFVRICRDAWGADHPALAALSGDVAYPVAVGAIAAVHGVPLAATLEAYLHGFAANLVSAAVRLIPLGQTDGQRILARLAPAVARLAAWAETATLDDLGGSAVRADMASMRHETMYSRLFRS
jgi:urease accessory protein